MVNEQLFGEFLARVTHSPVLESGINKKDVATIGSKFKFISFDSGSSRFAMTPMGFRAGTMVRLPYSDLMFGGFVSKNVFDNVGDREYFFKEIIRVTDGPILMVEVGVDSFPHDFLSEADDINVIMVSVNGVVTEINQTWAQLYARRDVKKIFSSPGGSLSKFNTLVPEDIKVEIGVLQNKTS